MKTQNKFWWFILAATVVISAIFVTLAFIFWQQLSELQQHNLLALLKDNYVYLLIAGILIFALAGFVIDWLYRYYIVPVNQLADEVQIITSVNPSHRISIHGCYDIVRLGEKINQNAEKYFSLRQDIKNRLQENSCATEKEKDILAALLEGLPQGIIVCNNEGRIVFFNRKVRSFFIRHEKEDPKWIGLGRSIYNLVDRALIDRAIERFEQKLAGNQNLVSERFLIGTDGTVTLPAEFVPVLDSQHSITGFIIYIEDTVEKFQKKQELLSHIQSWQHQLVQAVSVIKTTSEVIKDQSYESKKDHQELVKILCQESSQAAKILSKNKIINSLYPDRPWPLTTVDASEWSRYLEHRSSEVTEVLLTINNHGLKAQISIDMHHMTNAILFVIDQIVQFSGKNEIEGHLYQQGAWIYLDLLWANETDIIIDINQWKSLIPEINDLKLDISLADILRFHGAKLWTQRHLLPEKHSGIKLLLPALERAEMVSTNGHVTILPDSRPEFYDFDLFQQAGQIPELDNRHLAALSYTVFDTETTGLDPQGGDEIISVGALRIVNGRILYEDKYEQLIDPKRHIPMASIKYHGIVPEMLTGKPSIDKVLPAFHLFAQDTVLVGHNVAFDMRMLQMKEASTGVRFINPVMDTMLLSAVVHPAHHDHSLSAIAERLGVKIIGRHSAIGDATAAGEIFLKLISLLASNGITTLLEARQASEKTYYSRLKY